MQGVPTHVRCPRLRVRASVIHAHPMHSMIWILSHDSCRSYPCCLTASHVSDLGRLLSSSCPHHNKHVCNKFVHRLQSSIVQTCIRTYVLTLAMHAHLVLPSNKDTVPMTVIRAHTPLHIHTKTNNHWCSYHWICVLTKTRILNCPLRNTHLTLMQVRQRR